ncbi:MAG: type II CAAX endopeptidase family protein [Clostridia bacterium]
MKKLVYKPFDSSMAFLGSIVVQQILAIVFVIASTIIIGFTEGSMDAFWETEFATILTVLIAQFSFLIVFFIINATKNYDFLKAPRIKKNISLINIALCVVIAFVAVFGFSNLVGYFDLFLEYISYPLINETPLPLDGAFWLAVNLVLLAVLPAICEELIFRGVVLNGFRKLGNGKAIIFSALFFTLMHGNIQQTVFQFILGIILAFVVIKTGNLIYSMIIHFFNNSIVIVWQYFSESSGEISANWGNFLIALLIAIVASLSIYLLIKVLKKENIAKTKDKFVLNDKTGNLELESEVNNDEAVGINFDNGNINVVSFKSEKALYNEIEENSFKAEKMNQSSLIIFSIAVGLSSLFWLVDLLTKVFYRK